MSRGRCAAPAVRRQLSTFVRLAASFGLLPSLLQDAALILDKPVLFCVGAPTRVGAAPRERVANLALGAPVLGLVPGIDGA